MNCMRKWSTQEEMILINFWKDNSSEIVKHNSGRNNDKAYQKIVKSLNKLNIRCTLEEVKTKIKKLLAKYRNLTARYESDKSELPDWELYDKIHAFQKNLVTTPKVKKIFHKRSKNKYRRWTTEEELILIKVWKDHSDEIKKTSGRCTVDICVKIMENLRNINVTRSLIEIQNKIRYFSTKYRNQTRKCFSNPSIKPEWVHYEKINEFMTKDNIRKPISRREYRRRSWSVRDQSTLISIWEKYSEKLRRNDNNDDVYKEITETLLSLNVYCNLREVKTKIRNLFIKYKTYNREYEANPVSRPNWIYYDRIDKFMKKNKNMTHDDMIIGQNIHQLSNRKTWSRDEEKVLINVWHEFLDKSGRLTGTMCTQIQESLNIMHISCTLIELRRKIQKFIVKYKFYKEKQSTNPSFSINWIYFEILDKFLSQVYTYPKTRSKKHSKCSVEWTDDTDTILLNAWSECLNFINDENEFYDKIVDSLKLKNFIYTNGQVKSRILQLVSKFKNDELKLKVNPTYATTWKNYEDIKKLLALENNLNHQSNSIENLNNFDNSLDNNESLTSESSDCSIISTDDEIFEIESSSEEGMDNESGNESSNSINNGNFTAISCDVIINDEERQPELMEINQSEKMLKVLTETNSIILDSRRHRETYKSISLRRDQISIQNADVISKVLEKLI